MKKYYNYLKIGALLSAIFIVVMGINSCEEKDFTIIPDEQQTPNITAIEPNMSDIGTSVNLIGTNFSAVPSNNRVTFNGVLATVTSASPTTLAVTVPEGTTNGPVSLSIAQLSTEGPVFTVVTAPAISALSATGGAVGETIVISGSNFGASIGENAVQFNGVAAEITAASENEITVIIPEGATTGPLTVEFLGQTGTLEVFTIAPVILSFNPERGTGGDEIVITGTNFDPLTIDNNVSFNGVVAEVLSASTTELTVVVPPQANSGSIAVEIEQLLALSEVDFITVPTVASFSPDFAAPNAEVNLSGSNFSTVPGENIVRFNGIETTVVESTETSITVLVPEGSETGPVTVELNGETGTSEMDFVVDNSLVTITIAINDVNDDVEEAADGRMSLDSSDLELGEFDTAETPDLGLQRIGLRFNNVNIPTGVTIESANIVFVPESTPGAEPTEMTISGESTGNAAPYTEDLNNLSSRLLTTANAVWNIPEWDGLDTPNESRTSVDISTIITEIITLGDWADGNSMNFILDATGVSAGATENNVGREAETYDLDNPQEGAQLVITYRINE